MKASPETPRASVVDAAPRTASTRLRSGAGTRDRTRALPRHRQRRAARRVARAFVAVVTVAMLGVLFYPLVRDAALRPERSRALQGRELAATLGCFGCHGAEGRGGIGNPGSRRATIPGFTGSTLMMYVQNEGEIRQYILDGRPDRLADDPEHRAETAAQAIHMPAYRRRLKPGEIDALAAFVRVVSGMIEPEEEKARQGLEVARRMGCFGCHGELGMGGRDNPGSLKGYIPGFMGDDFRELVRDDDELREWIRRGHLDRIDRHPIGGWFTRRQLVEMPAFAQFLSDDESAALVALVKWINAGGWQRTPLG